MEKVCVNHPESPSVGSCRACEKPVCLMCIVEVQGVSFCSEACGSAYQEVKDWLDRPAAEEEWNPVAEAKAKAQAAHPQASDDDGGSMPAAKATPEPEAARAALSTAPAQAAPPPSPEPARGGSQASLYIGIAAVVLVVIGGIFLFKSDPAPTPTPTPVAVNPTKPEPAKPEPAKPEPVKPQPPKPEPAKPIPPKPEPVKPQPPKPEPAKPEPPKPEAAAHLAFFRDPWAKEKPGAWYRIKTAANGVESYRDVGLREAGAGYRVIVSQTSAAGRTEPEQFTWIEPEEVSIFGSMNGEAQGTKFAADVIRTKSPRPSQYVLKDGPHTGVAFASDAVLTKLAVEPVKVKDRTISCSLLETEHKDSKRVVKTWYSTQVPVGVVKTEAQGTTTALVDFGDDWAKRPPFPEPPVIAKVDPPKPEPVKPLPPKPEPVKPEPPKPEPAKPIPPKPEPVKPVPPKPEPAKPEPPKPEPAKPEPPKPEPVKPEPPKPEPVKPLPPKPEPPKPEPPKPEPVKPLPPKPEPAKPEPPKPEPPKPEPAKPEPVKPVPPKPEPPKPEPRKEDVRVKKSMTDAAGLIREATPLYQEVAGAMESLPEDKATLRELVRKAERVHLKLGDARILYTSVKADALDPAALDRRVTQLDELLESIQDAVSVLRKKLE